MSKIAEIEIRAWSAVLVASAVIWIVPVGSWWVPRWLRDWLVLGGFPPLDGRWTGARFGASFTDDTIAQIHEALPGGLALSADRADGVRVPLDLNLDWYVQATSVLEAPLWIALNVVPLLVMAVLWWWLAGVVAQSRREAVFTTANASRLTLAGAVIAVGAPALQVAHWLYDRHLLDGSQFADRAVLPGLDLLALPWGAVSLGAALVVLGAVWRKGAAKEHDLAGLV